MSAQPDPSSDLARVRALFEQWRARRSFPNQRIPQELWDAAVALLDSCPLQRVARELRLSVPRLRHQRDVLSPTEREAPRPHFVALPPSASSSALPSATSPSERSARLVLERPDGARLSLSVPADDAERLDALCRAFLAARS